MHAILPLISSNWHSSGQRDPTFSPWTSPVSCASVQLHLQQSFANQPSEEIVSSCLHFSSEVTTTSQPHLAGLKMRHLFGQRRLRSRAKGERGLCAWPLSTQTIKQPVPAPRAELLFILPAYLCTQLANTSAKGSCFAAIAECHAMKVLPRWLEAL